MSATAESIDVRITGDASGATGAMTRVGEAVRGAVTVMQQKLIDLGIASKESFGVVGESSLKAAAHVEESSSIIGHATEKMKMHMESVATKYEAVTGLMGKLNGVMVGALALLAGGEGFEKAIEKTNELAAANLKLSKTFGISLADASGMHAALAKFGIDTETVTGAVQKMDRQVRAHESTMNDMGVKTRDASGALLNQLDIFMGGIDALRQYKEGTDRNLAAQAMFGRGVGDVAALLKLNRKELEEGAESARKLGLVTDQEGVDSMKRYKVAINETKEVFEAIMVAIGKKVLPAITELAEYIKDNGAVVMERLGNALDILGTAFTTVGAVIGAAAAIVMALYDNALAPLLKIVDDLAAKLRDVLASATTFVMGHLDDLRGVASTLAGVLVTGLAAAVGYYATVTLIRAVPATIAFARALFAETIPALFSTVRVIITGIVPALIAMAEQLALNIVRLIALDAVNPAVWIGLAVGAVAALAAGFAYWFGWLDPIIAKMKTLWDWTSKFLGLDKAFDALAGVKITPASNPAMVQSLLNDSYQNGLGGTKSASDLLKVPKEKKAKADPSEMQDLEEGLLAKKLALDKQNNADNTFREMSKAEEAKYWQDILARTDLSAKDRHAITRKYLDASLADKKTNFAAMIAMQQAEIVADKGNGDAKIAMAHKIEAEMIAAYGKESKEAAQAGAARIRVEQAVAAERSKLAAEDAKSHEALALEVLSAEEAAAKHRREMGQITAKELLRQEQVFLAAKRAIQLQAIQAQIAAAKLSPDSVEAIKKLNDAKLLLEQKYLTARAALIAKAESQSTARVRQGIAEVSSSWGQALAKMATLQASFSETIKSLWQGVTSMITNALAGVIEQYLTNWLTSLLIGKGAQATTGLSGVESNAAVAGAAAYASTAAIPIIGPGLAPEAAWTAYGGAMSFAGLASFATGAWNLPGDMVAQVHKGEMIVPRTFAEDFRANGGNASGVGAVGGGGDTHIHLHGIVDGDSVTKLLHRNNGAVASALKMAVRNGVRP